jgi:hypothetical protein
MNGGESAWSDDERWQARLASDEQRLAEILSNEDREVVDGTRADANANGALAVLGVYGSVARDQRRADSDLDIYFEAADLPEPFNRTDPGHRWHVYGLPVGALLDNLRRGRQFAFDLIESALIVADRGPFRQLLIAVEREGLVRLEGG